MSGGYFDYDQYRIDSVADSINRAIETNDDEPKHHWSGRVGRGYSPETIARFREAVATLNRAAALEKAWAEYASRNGPSDAIAPAATHEVGFKSGFNTAWAVLIAEIGPLVADLRTNSALRQSDMNEIINHRKAVIRLRELTQEPGE